MITFKTVISFVDPENNTVYYRNQKNEPVSTSVFNFVHHKQALKEGQVWEVSLDELTLKIIKTIFVK